MEKETENDVSFVMVIIPIVITICIIASIFILSCIIASIFILSPSLVTEHKVIEGVVVDVVPVLDDKGGIDYLIVTFDNYESYKIQTNGDVDFTVNSEFILQLTRVYLDDEEPDDKWRLVQIIKKP